MAPELNYYRESRSWMRQVLYGNEWWAWLVRIIAVTVLVIISLVVVGLLLLAASASPFYAIILAAPLVAFVVAIIRQLRRRWAMRVLCYIDAAVRSNLPIADYLESAADSESRTMRKRLREVASLLRYGVPLGDAVASGAPELTAHETRLLHAGQRSGHLGEMLEHVSHGFFIDNQNGRHHAMLKWYVPLLTVCMLGVGGMISIFVMPKFQTIMRDFKIELTGVGRFATTFPQLIFQDGTIVLLAVLAVLLLLAWVAADVMRSVWPVSSGPWRPGGWLSYIPVIGSLGRNRSLADICRMLAVESKAQIPLVESVGEFATLPLEGGLQRHMQDWKTGLSAGQSPADAAREAGLPSLLCCILRTPGPGLSDALNVLADHYQTRYGRLRATLDAVAVPVVTGIGAAFVILMALSVFLPMIAMMDRVSSFMGGH